MIAINDKGQYESYAWPGGYPIYHVCADGGILCPDCANNERPEHLDPECPDDRQWTIIASEINYEDTALYCDHCNKLIEAAYTD